MRYQHTGQKPEIAPAQLQTCNTAAVKPALFIYGGDPVNDKEFTQMMQKLVKEEEQHLQVNSEEFNRRHEEIMDLIRRAERSEV